MAGVIMWLNTKTDPLKRSAPVAKEAVRLT